VSVNNASVKNKAVAANRPAAINKADDKLGVVGFSGGRQLPPFASLTADCLQLKLYYNRRVHSARFCSYEIEHKG
jgi:hypothetical protein